MKAFALTGGIASGKTIVARMFKGRGIPTISSDAIVASLYKLPSVKRKLLAAFGTSRKKALAEIVFSSTSKRKKLESILHPLVLKELKKALKRFRKARKAVALIEIPLLFEAEPAFRKLAGKIIVVYCTKAQQIARLQKQGFSKKQALQRIAAQMPLGKKIKKAHIIIDNSSGLPKTRAQVEKILGELNG